ncbi:Na+/H+ antiporter subunit A [soil metagenome]
MIALLALHALVGFGLIGAGARLGRRWAWVALLAPAITVAWLAAQLGHVVGGGTRDQRVGWMPSLGLDLDLRLDGFSAVMLVLISGIGVLVFAYSARYLPRTGPAIGRLLGLLALFSGAMVGLVLADNLLVLYGFWELTSITSFLLIGNDHRRANARAAALQALLVTGAGGLAMLGGFLLLGQEAGTYQLSTILASPPEPSATLSVALVLILLGAFTKSAQYPFHSWLPGAMVAPTPVSAYLHSATMVKAGVYLIARLSPAFAGPVEWWRPVVITVGLVTMIAGGLRALRQHDLKVLLAHGTVSQLGFMVAIFGVGTPEAMAAGAALLLAHGAFKAANFMVVGIIDHQFGTRDLRCLPRLDRTWWVVGAVVVIGAASMAGIPLAFGFIAKEAVIQAVIDNGSGPWAVVLAGVVIGSAITAAYSARFAWGALGRDASTPVDLAPRAVVPSRSFLAPAVILTLLTVELGVLPYLGDDLVGAAEASLHPNPEGIHLSIWHGLNLALALSAVAIVSGGALFVARRRVAPVLALGRHLPDANDGYHRSLRGLLRGADRVTAVAQPGSLPVYTGVILLTAAVLPLWALTEGGDWWPGWPQWIETPAHLPVAAVLIVAAIASSAVRRRFSAALFLGVVGYAMAALFVIQGSPDLALTQAAIETLTTVLFVLVLRRLPDRFGWAGTDRPSDPPAGMGADAFLDREGHQPRDSVMGTRRRALRLGVALSVAASVFVLAIVMSGPQPDTTAADAAIDRALPDGEGRNVVNVILVDFRGLDTLGEISVLAMAAIGTVALARAGRRRVGAPRAAPAHDDPADRREPPDGEDEAASRVAPALRLGRLVTLDVSVRVVFATVMVVSIYLLFVGHNQPGGGFVGGILAGAAVSLLYVAGGIEEVRRLSRARPWTILGVGLLIAAVAALTPLLLGDPVLSNGYVDATLPLIGYVKATSATAFDLGVYLCVLGLALMMFESFGDDPVAEEQEAPVVTDPRGTVPLGGEGPDLVGAVTLGEAGPAERGDPDTGAPT